MKKLFILILVIIFSTLCLSSCETSEYAKEQDLKEEAIYDRGYEAGYEEGKWEGIKTAQEHFAEYVLWDLSYDIENEYGMSPEEAITILEHYADGEPITEAELNQAIWTISRYYWDLYSAINDLDSYN